MQATVIQVGDSKGIMLNAALVDQYRIHDTVELLLENDCIIIKPVNKPRQHWDKAFAEMHENGDDALLIDSVLPDEHWD
jgi:antitoxin MazE